MMKKILALILCMILCPVLTVQAEEKAILELHQMVLGYADGYYLRCGDIEIMIDGGNPNPKMRNTDVVDCMRALGVDKLDMYIITHWHLDHCMNMNTVLAEFGDENTVVYGASVELPAVADGDGVEVAMSPLANGTYRQMKLDDVITIGDLVFTCIGPDKITRNGKTNAESLNFVLQYGTRRMLFTGDYAQSGEINTLYPELCSNVDVLKFPHHGGEPYEIGNMAARLVAPEYVLMPSQLNNYRVYCFLRDLGVKIEREKVLSNRSGHVVILTDGGDYIEARSDQNPADYAPKAN